VLEDGLQLGELGFLGGLDAVGAQLIERLLRLLVGGLFGSELGLGGLELAGAVGAGLVLVAQRALDELERVVVLGVGAQLHAEQGRQHGDFRVHTHLLGVVVGGQVRVEGVGAQHRAPRAALVSDGGVVVEAADLERVVGAVLRVGAGPALDARAVARGQLSAAAALDGVEPATGAHDQGDPVLAVLDVGALDVPHAVPVAVVGVHEHQPATLSRVAHRDGPADQRRCVGPQHVFGDELGPRPAVAGVGERPRPGEHALVDEGAVGTLRRRRQDTRRVRSYDRLGRRVVVVRLVEPRDEFVQLVVVVMCPRVVHGGTVHDS